MLLLLVGLPILIIVLIIRGLIRRGGNSSGEPSAAQRPPPLPTKGPGQWPARRSPQVRIVDDGFWINGNWPLGTRLDARYLTNGVASNTELAYQPGPDGQFVYTGAKPDSAAVVAVDSGESFATGSTQPPPLDSSRATRRSSGTPPPIYPSAY